MSKIFHVLCADNQVQICAIDGKDIVEKAQKTHDLSRVATAALGRQLLMTSMMGSRLKNESDRVSSIIKGDGYAGSMICTAFPNGNVKGCVQNPDTELPLRSDGKLDVSAYVGKNGKLTVVRDMGFGDPYVGVCNLVSGEIAVDFAEYFTVSEQQPSIVYLGVRLEAETAKVLSAGGLILQTLPGCDGDIINKMTELSSEISKLSQELVGNKGIPVFLKNVFGAYEPVIEKEIEAEYFCDCSRERIEKALISVGYDELTSMIEEDGHADVTCQFCNSEYHFTREDLIKLRWEAQNKKNEE